MSARLDQAPAKEKQVFGRSWIDRLGVNRFWSSIADRGRGFAALPAATINPGDRAKLLADALISGRGEASGAAVARELHAVLSGLEPAQRLEFYRYVAENFEPDGAKLAPRRRLISPSRMRRRRRSWPTPPSRRGRNFCGG